MSAWPPSRARVRTCGCCRWSTPDGPGMPRNHGVDAARGTYVQFVDQDDDYLFDGALEKLCATTRMRTRPTSSSARRWGSVARSRARSSAATSPGRRWAPIRCSRCSRRTRCSARRSCGRTASASRRGRVRLEDHLFVMQAYFAASTISILASEPCYAWVKQPGSASSARIEPETYFPHWRPSSTSSRRTPTRTTLRDRLLRHWFRGKILKRIAGRRMVKYPDEYRDRLLDVVVPLTQRRFGSWRGCRPRLRAPHPRGASSAPIAVTTWCVWPRSSRDCSAAPRSPPRTGSRGRRAAPHRSRRHHAGREGCAGGRDFRRGSVGPRPRRMPPGLRPARSPPGQEKSIRLRRHCRSLHSRGCRRISWRWIASSATIASS